MRLTTLFLSFLGGVGGIGGAGQQGGDGGAGEGPRINAAVKAKNFIVNQYVVFSSASQMLFLTESSIQSHGPGPEQQRQMNCEC
jgi:hypothetical protein